jgi:hypothetical protein
MSTKYLVSYIRSFIVEYKPLFKIIHLLAILQKQGKYKAVLKKIEKELYRHGRTRN